MHSNVMILFLMKVNKHSFRSIPLALVFAGFILIFTIPAHAQDTPSSVPGIITPPTVENEVIYFAHWPDTLYAFDESRNEVRWSMALDPPLADLDTVILPVPPPQTSLSAVIIHIGRQLWVVSKVDGHTIWSTSGLVTASHNRASATSNTLPGYWVLESDTEGTLVSMEEDSGFWFIRKRRLGDGRVDWERRLNGNPHGWWLDGRNLCMAYELFGPEGPASGEDRPGIAASINLETGENIWSTPVLENSGFRSSFQASPGRIFLTEETGLGVFTVRGFNRETGELYRSIDYQAGEFITVLTSGDKLVFLHREGSPEQKLIRFLLYYSSLNPIRFQTIRESVEGQIFENPTVDKSLLLCGSATYSLYDGNLVWQEFSQVSLVDMAVDDLNLYIWDAGGKIMCLDRLYGQEKWSTPFNVLPPDSLDRDDLGGASLSLVEQRLFAATPAGELIRIDSETGEPYPGILRVTSNGPENSSGQLRQNSSGDFLRLPWFWVSVVIVLIFGIFFLTVSAKGKQSEINSR